MSDSKDNRTTIGLDVSVRGRLKGTKLIAGDYNEKITSMLDFVEANPELFIKFQMKRMLDKQGVAFVDMGKSIDFDNL